MMKKIVRGTLVATAVVLAFAVFDAGRTALAQDPKAAIEKRQMTMKAIGGHMKAISDFVNVGKGSAGDIAKRAAEISAAAKMLPSLFPATSGNGMVTGVKTDALGVIWTDMAYFTRIFATLDKEAVELQRVALSGDKAAIQARMGMLGKNACGACHRTFRAK